MRKELSPEEAINRMFEIENDANLIKFKTEDEIPVYFMGKHYLMYQVVMPEITHLKHPSTGDRRINKNAFLFLIKTFFHNVFYSRNIKFSEIVFYSSTRHIIIDGKYFNRYTDFYTDIDSHCMGTIEQTAMDWTWPYPRHNDNVIYDGLNVALSRILSKFSYKKDMQPVSAMVNYYFNRVAEICKIQLNCERREEISRNIAQIIGEIRGRAKWVDSHISDKTKLVVMIGGGYPWYYPINRVLKKKGIKTADLQHGYITKYNLAYSFAPAIKEADETKLGIADYFLTYGNWWNGQIMNPSEKYAVGNPYREYQTTSLKVTNANKILVVGCGINTEMYIKLTAKVSTDLKDYEVVFRPHPGEVLETKKILEERGISIRLDKERDVYESLKNSRYVVSEVSTVLFEAIGICKYIVVMNTGFSKSVLPEHPFFHCETAEELIDLIRSGKEMKTDNLEEVFWKKNAKGNFKEFLKYFSLREGIKFTT